MTIADPHGSQPVLHRGASLSAATAATILVHGRGATAEDILSLADELPAPGMTYLAPQAAGFTWYPNSFLAPIASNEPGITSGLNLLSRLLDQLADHHIPPERTLLLGFSQGACLTLEFAARHARRYGGVAGLSGGLIGPPGTPREYSGSLEGTPVFLGCSTRDPHIPAPRVKESAQVLRQLGAVVTTKLYPDLGHTVSEDELVHVRDMINHMTNGVART